MKGIKEIKFVLTTIVGCLLVGIVTAQTAADIRREARALIGRVLPEKATWFEVAVIPQDSSRDCFELSMQDGKVLLSGNNGLSIAGAFNYYLEQYAHCQVTWNGSNLHLPDTLPVVASRVHRVTPYQYRYYFNYCTFNYTMSWWDWDRWQQEIDWMAMHGINMPLALTGQNIIWQRVYKKLGFTDAELKGFFSGPAYFNWFWMGNLDGWGGPLPQSWMDSHEALQKKILARERALGMKPVLPAFTGHVPPAFQQKFPQAKLKTTHWSDFPEVYLLDPDDPMFAMIGQQFLREEIQTYGTDHLYSADTFNENTPPTNDSAYLDAVSKKVYEAMASVDAEATWVMQGWLFHFSAKFWQPAQIKALLNAVPNEHMLILDLWSERYPVWDRTEAYYGKPWIWCMLHNFGGNIGMYGRMEQVSQNPAAALHNPAARRLSGIGLTPEAIEQNPVMYALMLENVWRDQPVDVSGWLKNYIQNRYGASSETMEGAWDILRHTVYQDDINSGSPESIIVARPTFEKNARCVTTRLDYAPGRLLPAWDAFVQSIPALGNSDGFRYDLVDITRQLMANYADTLQQSFAKAFEQGDRKRFKQLSRQFIALIGDMDRLLATRKDFLLGSWLSAARAWGTNTAEADLYEKNARDLITLWGGPDSRLHEYACKQWAGLLNGFYKPRWEQFFQYVSAQAGKPDMEAFENSIKTWEWNWVNQHETYSTQPVGDPVKLVQIMYRKYRRLLGKIYGEADSY